MKRYTVTPTPEPTQVGSKGDMYAINKIIALEILHKLPENKLNVLRKALVRNYILTSSYDLEHGTLTIYKEGYYLEINGTRVKFSVFAYDNDGELIIAERKPHNSKLSKLYDDYMHFDESDFDFI